MVSPVPVLSIVFSAVAALICFGVPIALGVHCFRVSRHCLTAICTGAICFILSVLVLEQIFHSIVFALLPALPTSPLAYTAYGCLAAGLFEETARLLGLKYLCKKLSDAPVMGLAYGVGHGGIEAIMLSGMSMISNLMVMVSINMGDSEALLAGLEGDTYDIALAQLQQASSISPADFLAGGVERLAAIGLHIALSMLIWMVVTRRLPLWGYALAILLRAVSNVPAGLYQTGILSGIWPTEVLTILAAAGIGFAVWKLYQKHRAAPAA